MKSRSYLPVTMAICLGVLLAVQASADSFSNSHSPQISFSHISTNEGLSQGTVVSSCQDRFGRMWFATHDGLNMYDGTRFTIYKNVQDDSTSLIDNIIRKVYCDNNGDIWVGTEKGLSYYALSLAFNFVWSILFFNFRIYLASFAWLLVLLALIICTILSYKKASRLAAYLQIPYAVWVIFAGYLNLAIWFLNK